jgi:hypothetical protein
MTLHKAEPGGALCHVAGSGFSPLFQEYFEGLCKRWDS